LNVLYRQDEVVAHWVSQHIDGCDRGFGQCKALGVASNGKIIAGVVYHNWSPETEVIEISSAAISPKWASRRILTELLAYPFSICRLVTARFSENNTRAKKLWKAFGSDFIRLPDMRADGEAEIVALLKLSQWNKSRLYNGQE